MEGSQTGFVPCSTKFSSWIMPLVFILPLFVQQKYIYLSIDQAIIIIIIYLLIRFFHITISWWFSQEIEWQQVSSSLLDSSQYSGSFQ